VERWPRRMGKSKRRRQVCELWSMACELWSMACEWWSFSVWIVVL
jgi:hypothetical protein